MILSRKTGESFKIGDGVEISVLAIEGRRVRLAIQAPQELPIVRSELLEAVDANLDSAQGMLKPSELMEFLHTAVGLTVDSPEAHDTPAAE